MKHESKYPFKCTECPRCFREVKDLEHHFSKEHKNEYERVENLICPKCPEVFTHLYKLSVHDFIEHGDKNPVSCDQCKGICLDFGRTTLTGPA